jgi:hypothetical protein
VWTENFSIVEGAANAGAFRYMRLNSVYDVDTNLGSTTTPGFTEWSAFYGNYRVHSTSIRLEAIASGGSAGSLAVVCLVPNSNQATLPSNPTFWAVQPQSVHKSILMYGSGGTNKVTFVRRYDIASIFRVTRQQFLTDFDYTATTGSNPSRQAYVAITILGIGSSSAETLLCNVYVSMDIEFFNPIQLSS